MPLTPPAGFLSALITASGISIYAALRALDPACNWPSTARSVHIVVTGAVTLTDGKHLVATALPTGVMLPFGTQGYAQLGVYLDNMFVAGGGTLALWIFT